MVSVSALLGLFVAFLERVEDDRFEGRLTLDGQPLIAAVDLVDEAEALMVEGGAEAPVAAEDVADELLYRGAGGLTGKVLESEGRIGGFADPGVFPADLKPDLFEVFGRGIIRRRHGEREKGRKGGG